MSSAATKILYHGINYANIDHILTQDGFKGALGSKKTETDKSTTVPVGDGPSPPPKPVSVISCY